MRKYLLLLLLFTMALSVSSCGTVIPPGEVGIKVNKFGTARGVQDMTLRTGWVGVNPWSEILVKYPVYAHNYIWTRDKEEGSPTNEEISFNSIEGTNITADIGCVLSATDTLVPQLYVKYRKPLDDLIDTVVRNELRDAFVRVAGTMTVMDIMGAKKAELLDRVKADINVGPLGTCGVRFQTVSFVNNPRPDPQVQETINNVIKAMNTAKSAQAKVVEAQAVADQKVMTARGDSASFVITATGQAEANRRLNASLTPLIIQNITATKWDGVLPSVTGGAMPMVNMQDLVKK